MLYTVRPLDVSTLDADLTTSVVRYFAARFASLLIVIFRQMNRIFVTLRPIPKAQLVACPTI